MISVLAIGTDDVLNDVDESRDGSEDDADYGEPRLMKVLVGPGTNEPADDHRAGEDESDLDAGLSFDDGVNAARSL